MNTPLKYSLSTVSEYIGINEQTGAVSVIGDIDAETTNTINLIALASDGVHHAQVFVIFIYVILTITCRCR